jgi:zinc D-Ala-D-Ala dipeptidase
MNSLKIKAKYVLFFLLIMQFVIAQDSTKLNQYGLWVINNTNTYKNYIATHNNHQLVDIKQYIPTIQFSLQYATKNNFTHTVLYPSITTTFASKQLVIQLQKVQNKLAEAGLGLLIFDAYRPYNVTQKMWHIIPDDRYAANPTYGSGHNRGIAVDVTLIHLTSNKVVDMGTAFDNFSDTAHHSFTLLPSTILNNRSLLKTTMEQCGFIALATEWWHYSLPNAKQYALLNISFKLLKKIK